MYLYNLPFFFFFKKKYIFIDNIYINITVLNLLKYIYILFLL